MAYMSIDMQCLSAMYKGKGKGDSHFESGMLGQMMGLQTSEGMMAGQRYLASFSSIPRC